MRFELTRPNLGKVSALPLSYARIRGYGGEQAPLPESRGKPQKQPQRKWVSPALRHQRDPADHRPCRRRCDARKRQPET
jgi:hypothetical protein